MATLQPDPPLYLGLPSAGDFGTPTLTVPGPAEQRMLDLAIVLLCAAIGVAMVGFGGVGSSAVAAACARPAFAVLVFLYCWVLVARQRVP